jgi:hypothetical protein
MTMARGERKEDGSSQKDVAKKQIKSLSPSLPSIDVKWIQGNCAMTSQTNDTSMRAWQCMSLVHMGCVCALSKCIDDIANLGCPPASLLSKIARRLE